MMTASVHPALAPDVLAALLPSDDDVALYRERGFYISKVIIDESTIDAACAGAERFYAEDVDEPRAKVPKIFWPTGEYPGLRKHDYARMLNRELEQLVLAPVLGAIAARLSASSSIRLWHDQLLYKPADVLGTVANNVGWHTDRSYWQCCSSDNMLTAWIPFHDCDANMGTVTMIEGSHHWPASDVSDFFDSDLEAAEARLRDAGRQVKKVPMELRKGQVSFHHCRTLHGSGPNRTERPRQSVAVHLQDADNAYRVWHDADGQQADHCNNDMARQVGGVPDYTDEQYFPVLWPAPGQSPG